MSARELPASARELQALEALTFNWTSALEDVWRPARYHVEGLHGEASWEIRRGVGDAAVGDPRVNPLGLPLLGQRGVGKTHLLGWAREQVQAVGGYFFLLGDLTRKSFWDEARTAVVQQLQPLSDGSRDQLGMLLGDLADRACVAKPVRDAVTGATAPAPADVSAFIAALRRLDPSLAPPCLDHARALVLLASPEADHQDIGYYFLDGGDVDAAERRPWGIRSKPRTARFVLNQVSQLLALSGPSVVAVDQIDALIDEVGKGTDASVVTEVATGLMNLRDTTRRTFTIISCLPESWDYVKDYAVDTVVDRFRSPCVMQNIPTADVGRQMIEKRFTADYARAGFEPPYPTWPIKPLAFEDAMSYTARSLLKRIDAHVRDCLRQRKVTELDRLSARPGLAVPDDAPGAAGLSGALAPSPGVLDRAPGTAAIPPGSGVVDQQPAPVSPLAIEDPLAIEQEFAVLDARFRELWRSADVSAALVAGTEDAVMPGLLDAGLDAWMRERGESDALAFVRERQPGKNPALHAELRMIIDDRTEAQRRWAFRAIAATNAIAVLSRLRNAITAIGLDSGTAYRQLFILRDIPWPTGKKTGAELADFAAKGGETLPATIADLQTFAALRTMLAERHPELNAWLVARQHAHETELLSRALGDLAPTGDMPAAPGIAVSGATPPDVTGQPDVTRQGVPEGVPPKEQLPQEPPCLGEADDTVTTLIPRSLRVGRTIPGGMALRLDLAMLRKHAVLFAGSGSGKTVMLRRIIEECALRGVSAIVLDPNNDLARLGDAWPEPPAAWSAADAELSHQYLASTDVVIWTPRRQAGRPLAFRPLPDFAALRDDGGRFVPDEFNAAVDAAVGAVAPRLIMGKGPVKAEEEKAVLREALRYFGESGSSGFDSLIALLDELPQGASSLPRKARATAADLAQRLRVAQINDPLFAGEGEPADPGTLLTPPPGKRARVSVISMIGLPDDEQRQSFVNQLQMALFSWLRKNPSPGLGGLLVMDEAQSLVPSDKATACTESTLRLTAQARKFGLGLLFATQAPKGVHNRIPGNATTQFYGLLNSPVQINTARELARAKGSDVPDIGRLSRGQFYVATEGTSFVKVATPLCLSHHPDGPLTEEEVIARARR